MLIFNVHLILEFSPIIIGKCFEIKFNFDPKRVLKFILRFRLPTLFTFILKYLFSAFQSCCLLSLPLALKWTRCWIELQIRWQILDLSGLLQQSTLPTRTKAVTHQELDTSPYKCAKNDKLGHTFQKYLVNWSNYFVTHNKFYTL